MLTTHRPFTPYSIIKFCEIAIPFFPPGVLQVLNGDDLLGPLIVEHPGIPKISFTGSTATGKRIATVCARLLKRVGLELCDYLSL
jgi:acyl-CoA reductase-like NAD-dependent aldehyde dehydrogenase